jgi:hypothetical protein
MDGLTRTDYSMLISTAFPAIVVGGRRSLGRLSGKLPRATPDEVQPPLQQERH